MMETFLTATFVFRDGVMLDVTRISSVRFKRAHGGGSGMLTEMCCLVPKGRLHFNSGATC